MDEQDQASALLAEIGVAIRTRGGPTARIDGRAAVGMVAGAMLRDTALEVHEAVDLVDEELRNAVNGAAVAPLRKVR